MAESRKFFESPKPWEVLGTFFGFFAVAKDAPANLRTLGVTKLVPEKCKSKLFSWNGNPDFWLLVLFASISVIVLLYFIPRKREPKRQAENDRIVVVSASIRRGNLIRLLRSLGLVWIREKLLDWIGVALYGTFRRPRDWPLEPARKKWIDRITLDSGVGFEFQYMIGYQKLSVREHPRNSDTYGPPIEREPTWKDARLLLLASNYFPIWLLANGIVRIAMFIRKLV
jgi:hypothetical protein